MGGRKPRVTSIDVATRAGVSQSAVSRAFTPGSSVSDETRRKVLDAARALNYVPNSMARSLITARSNIVAMVVGDLSNPYYGVVLDLFSKELQDHGKHVLMFRVANGSEVDDALISVLQYQVDGIVITSAQLSSKMAGLCLDRGVPVIMFNRYIEGLQTDSVCCDNIDGGRAIAQHLLAAGGRRFGLIAGERQSSTNKDRTEGFLTGLSAAGIDPDTVPVAHGHYTYDGGYAAALQLFADRGTTPDALFCTNDIMALGAMDALRETMGYRVPDDVMVVGFDDIPEASRPPYRLTTFRHPRRRMIAKALELLNVDGSQTRQKPATHFIKGHLIERATVRPLAPASLPDQKASA